MKVIFIIFPLLFCTSLLASESDCNFTVSGVVVDSSTGQPLGYTSVEAHGIKNKGASSDVLGRFTLTGICAGKFELHISHLQCEHIHLQLDIHSDTFITIYLKHSDEIAYSGKVTGVQGRDESLNSLSLRQLELSKGKSISEMMQQIGGVTLLKTGNTIAKPVVNGMYGNRVIIFNNGIRQEGQNWGLEHAPEIDAFTASDVTLLKGAEALRYAADGVGGVLIVKPYSVFREKPRLLKGEFNTGINTNGRSGYASFMLGNKLSERLPLYWRLQGTVKRGGNIRTPDYFVANTGMMEMNYSAVLGYEFKRLKAEVYSSTFYNMNGIYKGSQTGNVTDLMNAIHSDTPRIIEGFTYKIDRPYQEVVHHLYKGSFDYQLTAKTRLQGHWAYQQNHRKEYDILRSSTAYRGPDFDYYLNTHTGELAVVRNDFHAFNITAGLSYNRQANSFTGRFFVPGYYSNGVESFVLVSRKLNKTSLSGALRYGNKSLEAFLWNNNLLNVQKRYFQNIAYALQADFEITRKLNITAIVSSAWRPPAPNELYSNGLHQGLASIEVGDSAMKAERAFHQSVNIKYNDKGWMIESEVFFKYISGYINLQPVLPPRQTIRGAFPVFQYVQQNVILSGLSMYVKKDIGRDFFVKMNGQLLTGTTIETKLPLSQLPPFSGKLFFGYSGKDWLLQLWCQGVARQFRYSEGSDYAPPPPGYVLIGADVSRTFNIKKQPLKLSLGVNNLLNTKYRDYLNRFRYFTDEQGLAITLKLSMPLNIKTNSLL